jgi:hypothetical protein
LRGAERGSNLLESALRGMLRSRLRPANRFRLPRRAVHTENYKNGPGIAEAQPNRAFVPRPSSSPRGSGSDRSVLRTPPRQLFSNTSVKVNDSASPRLHRLSAAGDHALVCEQYHLPAERAVTTNGACGLPFRADAADRSHPAARKPRREHSARLRRPCPASGHRLGPPPLRP